MIERLSYEPHGKRRNVDWTTPAQALLAVNTDRGFTGHEHLDEIGLIHMTKSPQAGPAGERAGTARVTGGSTTRPWAVSCRPTPTNSFPRPPRVLTATPTSTTTRCP